MDVVGLFWRGLNDVDVVELAKELAFDGEASPEQRHAPETPSFDLTLRFVEKINKRQPCALRDVGQANVRCDCSNCADVCAGGCQALREASKVLGEFDQFAVPDIRQHSGDIGVRNEQSGGQPLRGAGIDDRPVVVHCRANSETADNAKASLFWHGPGAASYSLAVNFTD